MRFTLCIGALALCAAPAAGQQADSGHVVPMPANTGPECVPGPAGGSSADSLCVSRSEAISRALVANPQLQIAGAQNQEARARKVQTVCHARPGVQRRMGRVARSVRHQWRRAAELFQASITIPFFDKFRLNDRIGNADVRSTKPTRPRCASRWWRRRRRPTTTCWPRCGAAAICRRSTRWPRISQKKTQARYDAGTVARLDVVNAQVARAQAENDLIANERDIANARAALNRLLGRPLGAPLADRRFTLVRPRRCRRWSRSSRRARHRPELASLQHSSRPALTPPPSWRGNSGCPISPSVSARTSSPIPARAAAHRLFVSDPALLLESQQG